MSSTPRSGSHSVADSVDRVPLEAAVARCLHGAASEWTASYEALNRQLSSFAETPLLLDVHLAPLLRGTIETLRADVLGSRPCSVEAASVMYVFCKVRGADAVGKLLPYEVSFLEPVARCLSDAPDGTAWECLFVLLVWLGQLVLVPFDLNTVHAQAGSTARLVELGKQHLATRGKPSDAAQHMLARLLTRPDLEATHLRQFLEWAVERIASHADDPFLTPVLYAVIARIFAVGARERLLPLVDVVFPLCKWNAAPSPLLRKNVVKMAQRVGLAFLAPRVAPWRYQRGHRMLLAGTVTAQHDNGREGAAAATAAAADLDWDVPIQVDRVVYVLLCGLRDKDTVVRWSAAKGIGRLTDRLPLAFADVVVETVMELCSPTEEEAAWHGSCLAIAELARRGLLLPTRLQNALPAVLEALRYDVKQGTRSVGSQVRDAACYVLWACARAVLASCTGMVAGALLETAALDREINCRRAASAAFQEHVGRVGLIKHGIDLVMVTDYFHLGSLRSAYRDVALRVCSYAEYTPWMLETLVRRKICHWDARVREEAARLVGAIAPMCVEQLVALLKGVREGCGSATDVDLRHGSLLTMGHAVCALTVCGVETAQLFDLGTIVPEIEAARLFRGKGGELVRVAACVLTQCLAESRTTLTLNGARLTPHLKGRPDGGKTSTKRHKEFLDECLRNASTALQAAAALALTPFCSSYLCPLDAKVREAVVGGYVSLFGGADPLPSYTRGAALALGALPSAMFDDASLSATLSVLCGAMCSSGDAATRQHCVQSLARVLERDGTTPSAGAQSACVAAVLHALRDYTLDERGDVGSWTREAACVQLPVFLRTLQWPQAQVDDAVSALLENMSGRMDRLRQVALAALQSMLASARPTDTAELLRLFPPAVGGCDAPPPAVAETSDGEAPVESPDDDSVAGGVGASGAIDDDDAAPSTLWAACAACLALPLHRRSTLAALCTSAGVRAPDAAARSALLQFLLDRGGDALLLRQLWDDFVVLLQSRAHDERLLPHLLCCCDVIVRNGCFDGVIDDAAALAGAAWDAYSSSQSIPVLCSGIDVSCALLRFAGGAVERLRVVVTMLGHAYPRVRQHAALQLHLQFLALDTLCGDAVNRDRITFFLMQAQSADCASVLPQVQTLLGVRSNTVVLSPTMEAASDEL